MYECFLSGDDMAFLTDCVVQFVAYGIGFGAIVWLVGWMFHWVSLFVRY